jgi:hypothetical protein
VTSRILAHLPQAEGARAAVPGPDIYINQFLLGPAFAGRPAGWQRFVVADELKLSAHPDLACTQITAGTHQLTLLGHMLDPLVPAATNSEILHALTDAFTDRAALIAATNRIGGRWLLIAANGAQRFLFSDALGLRQAFYTDPCIVGALWIMSQPGLASEVFEPAPDDLAERYVDSPAVRRTPEYRWPATGAPFKGLHHLLPNHWLDLRNARAARFWPIQPLKRISPDAAIERLMVLLPGQIKAAASRFELALGLTAGLDSRMVLAAARELAGHIAIVTVRQGKMPDTHPDLETPARLLRRVGLEHQVIRADSTMTADFSRRYKRNVHMPHDHYGHDAEAILKHFGRTRAVLTGSGAEVGRCPFRTKLPHARYVRFTPELVSWLELGVTEPFAVARFAEWLDDAGSQKHVKLLDLLEWEQDYGNWLAMTQLEFDIAWRESFTPYNCRELIATVVGVPERYRREPDYVLFREFIRQAWPELLSEPINPHIRSTSLSRTVRTLKSVAKHWLVSREHTRAAQGKGK